MAWSSLGVAVVVSSLGVARVVVSSLGVAVVVSSLGVARVVVFSLGVARVVVSSLGVAVVVFTGVVVPSGSGSPIIEYNVASVSHEPYTVYAS